MADVMDLSKVLAEYGFSLSEQAFIIGAFLGSLVTWYFCKNGIAIHRSALDARGETLEDYRGQVNDYQNLVAALKISMNEKDRAFQFFTLKDQSKQATLKWLIFSGQVRNLENQMLLEAFKRLHVYNGKGVSKKVAGAPSVYTLYKKLDSISDRLYPILTKHSEALLCPGGG